MEQEKKRTTKPQSERGTHCIARTQEKLTSQAQHVHMLHKAYPALNQSRHLAHLTGTQKKPEREPQAHTADDGLERTDTREAEPAGKTTDPATANPSVWEDGVQVGGIGEDRRRSELAKLATATVGPRKERSGRPSPHRRRRAATDRPRPPRLAVAGPAELRDGALT
jgi:hypothetical protein